MQIKEAGFFGGGAQAESCLLSSGWLMGSVAKVRVG